MDKDNLPALKSSDLYECAYYFSNGCTVKNIEIVQENKKEICFLFMTGENLLSLQQNYFKSEASINLFDFRRSYSRLMNLVALAKKESRDSLRKGVGKMTINQLHQPGFLDLTKSKIETTDPVIADYYRAAFYEVKNRYEDNRYIFTIDVDKIKSRYTAEEIESRQLVLMNFIAFFNSNMNLLSLLEKKLSDEASERSKS